MKCEQLDLFSINTAHEIKNLRRWINRLEKRVNEMEMRQQLIEHAKKTGFKQSSNPIQIDMFGHEKFEENYHFSCM